MTLVDHARKELELLGEFESDPAYAQSIVAAVAAFASYGHSGGSAMIAIQVLNELLQYKNLTPLTDNPDEWVDHGEISGTPLYQNRRNGEAFSYDGGVTYYLLSERDAVHPLDPPFHPSEHAELPEERSYEGESPCI